MSKRRLGRVGIVRGHAGERGERARLLMVRDAGLWAAGGYGSRGAFREHTCGLPGGERSGAHPVAAHPVAGSHVLLTDNVGVQEILEELQLLLARLGEAARDLTDRAVMLADD